MKNNSNKEYMVSQKLPIKDHQKKNNLITSLNEVECFLNNLDSLFTSVKLINILKKFK